MFPAKKACGSVGERRDFSRKWKLVVACADVGAWADKHASGFTILTSILLRRDTLISSYAYAYARGDVYYSSALPSESAASFARRVVVDSSQPAAHTRDNYVTFQALAFPSATLQSAPHAQMLNPGRAKQI